MTSHPSAIDLELYIVRGLGRMRASRIEDHVAGCEPCASRLADEAALDLALEQIARVRPIAQPIAPAPRCASTIVCVAMLAAAAAFVLILGRQSAPPDPDNRQPVLAPPAADAGAALARDDGGDSPP